MTETVFPRGQPTGGVRRSRSPSPVKTGSSSRSLSDRLMLTGSLVDRAAPEKSHVQKERCVLARAMWLYIQENRETGYAMKWSEWLEAHSRTVTMQVGDKLEGNGFSSDPLVVTDSLEAVFAGTATVLSDHTVLNITVQ